MILMNSQKATLIKYNRTPSDNVFDDEDQITEVIKVVPYHVDIAIQYGAYSVPEATGYFQVGREVDVKEGDQIKFIGNFNNTKIDLATRTLSVLKVEDVWLFNRVEYKWVAVK